MDSHQYDNSFAIVPALTMEVKITNPITKKYIVRKALIDTGSDATRLPPNSKDDLELEPFSEASVGSGMADATPRTTFLAIVSWNGFKLPAEVYFAKKDIDYILIGRNVLNQLVMHCDGPKKMFHFDCF